MVKLKSHNAIHAWLGSSTFPCLPIQMDGCQSSVPKVYNFIIWRTNTGSLSIQEGVYVVMGVQDGEKPKELVINRGLECAT